MSRCSSPSAESLSRIFVRSASGEMVQLSNVVTVREAVAPRDLRRFNQLRAITIEANLSPGYTLGEAIAAFHAAAQEILPDGAVTDAQRVQIEQQVVVRLQVQRPRVVRGGDEPDRLRLLRVAHVDH